MPICNGDRPGFLRRAAILAAFAGSSVAMAQTYDEFGEQSFGVANPARVKAPSPDGDSVAPRELSSEDIERLKDDVRVSETELVELHVRDEDLSTVLQMLALQSERSIVMTQNVSGTVTANLFRVSIFEALDALLYYNGFRYITEGDIVYVLTADEVAAIEAAKQERVAEVIELKHMTSADAAAFATPLLSRDGGSIQALGSTSDYNNTGSGPVGNDSYAGKSMIVVFDYPGRIDMIRSLIERLDTKPSQVLVEATILQSAITEANAFGVDFAFLANLEFSQFTSFGGPLSVVNTIISGGGSGTGTGGTGGGTGGGGGGGMDPGMGGTGTGGGTAIPADNQGFAANTNIGGVDGAGGLKLGVVADSFAAFIRLLDEAGDTTIISNPKVLTLNRQAASVQVGRRVGYLSTTTTDTSTSETVEFLDTGTQLRFRPFVTGDGYIRMELQPEVSNPIIRTVSDSTGNIRTIPDEDTSKLSTNVLVRDGNTIVLGGLFVERTAATRRQVPFLGDIPVLGAAFRGQEDTTDRSEIIFMITPSVVEDGELAMQGEKGMSYVKNVRAGAREGLLIWSRERQSSQLLVEAERFAAQGDNEQALEKVKRSLALNPSQPEAIELRSRLMNKSPMWPSRNLLDEIIGDEAARRAEAFAAEHQRDLEAQRQAAIIAAREAQARQQANARKQQPQGNRQAVANARNQRDMFAPARSNFDSVELLTRGLSAEQLLKEVRVLNYAELMEMGQTLLDFQGSLLISETVIGLNPDAVKSDEQFAGVSDNR